MNQLTGAEPATLWEGRTLGGLPLVVERDERRRWVATVAGTMQSRNASPAIAVAEATGLSSRHPWVTWIARMCVSGEASLAAR
jgi:hypothetical protein